MTLSKEQIESALSVLDNVKNAKELPSQDIINQTSKTIRTVLQSALGGMDGPDTAALDIFLNAVDMDGWVYPEGKHQVEDGFSIMTPEQHTAIRAALQRNDLPQECTEEMAEAFRTLFNECQRTFTAPTPRQVWEAMLSAAPKPTGE